MVQLAMDFDKNSWQAGKKVTELTESKVKSSKRMAP